MSTILRQLVRQYIQEAAVSVASAASQGLGLYVDDYGDFMNLVLFDADELQDKIELMSGEDKETMESLLDDAVAASIRGYVRVDAPEAKQTGPCGDAWIVKFAAAVKGYGPMMYDIAMNIAPSGAITADRNLVSPDAKKIWAYYNQNRSDVKKMPFDDIGAPKTPPKEDDCRVHRHFDMLNYAYSGNGQSPSQLTARAKGLFQTAQLSLHKAIPNVGRVVQRLLLAKAGEFFDNQYEQMYMRTET